MPTLLTRTPPRSNFGTGVQPERRTTAEINQQAYPSVAAPAPRNMGSFTPQSFAPRAPAPTDPNRMSSGGTITAGGLTRSYAGGRPQTQLNPLYNEGQDFQPATAAPGIGARTTFQNFVQNNPGSMAARAAPQQTERANPLTGDNNLPMEGQTAAVKPPPFIQRGAGVPRGQDASTMGGTGVFKRSFGSPQAASAYTNFLQKLYPTVP